MWAEAERIFALHTSVLHHAGLPLTATLEPCVGVMSAYREGVVYLALPELETPMGQLRTTMLATLMGADQRDVAWLFRALLPRLIAHEIGHALRGERGLITNDVRAEEQIADRMGCLLATDMIDARDRSRAKSILTETTHRLGGVEVAAALHRLSSLAVQLSPRRATQEETASALATLQHEYHRNIVEYLRISSAWAWIDLCLDPDDSLARFAFEHLDVGELGRSSGC